MLTEELLEPTGITNERRRFGPGGGRYSIVATGTETHNAMFSILVTEPPGGGPPLHIHTREEEFFYVLEGQMTFYIDGQVRTAGPGQSAFVPRGVPHCFKNCTDRVARVLIVFTPGDIDGFFDFGRPVAGRTPTEEELLAELVRLAPIYGLEVLGPSPL